MKNAVLGRGSGGCEIVRLLASGILLSVSLGIGTARCAAADLWGGSLDLTSDYLVRGISRTDNRAALQLDVHYLDSSGVVAGLFASNTQIDPFLSRDVELDAFLGYVWTVSDDWQGRALVSHYAYPWNQAGSSYDYTELNVDLSYRAWLNFTLTYSPDAAREAYHRLIGVSSESAEVSLQRPMVGRLSATAGLGVGRLMNQQRRPHLPQDRRRFNGLIGRVRRDAGVKRPARPNRSGERAHRLFQLCIWVTAVRVVDIQPVRTKPLQAPLALSLDLGST